MTTHAQMLTADLEGVVTDAEKVLRHYGLKAWRLTLVARHPDPAHSGEYVVVTADDPDAVAALLNAQSEKEGKPT